MSGAGKDYPFSRCDDADGRAKPGPEQMTQVKDLCARRLCFLSRDFSPEKANAAVEAVYNEAELNIGIAGEFITVEPYEDRTDPPEFWKFTFWQLVEKLARDSLSKNNQPQRTAHFCIVPGGCKCGCSKT